MHATFLLLQHTTFPPSVGVVDTPGNLGYNATRAACIVTSTLARIARRASRQTVLCCLARSRVRLSPAGAELNEHFVTW
jgi:hypothetical protein